MRHAACIGEMRNACTILSRKHQGKRSIGRHSIDKRIIWKWILDEEYDMFHIHPSMDECWINEMYMNVM
jgi:hypothetical protein